MTDIEMHPPPTHTPPAPTPWGSNRLRVYHSLAGSGDTSRGKTIINPFAWDWVKNFFWLLSEYLRMHSCRTVLEDRSTVPSVSALLGTPKLRDEPANALLGHLKEKHFIWERKPSVTVPTHVTGMDFRSCVPRHCVTSKPLTE